MPQYLPAKGFKEMENLLKMHDKKKVPIYIYFYGEKDKQGRSWCPDCVEAEETIMTAFRDHAPADCLILVVDVGDRAFWMDKANSFRSPPYSVDGIPALLHWKGVERLDGDQLLKANLLQLFFEETGAQKSTHATTSHRNSMDFLHSPPLLTASGRGTYNNRAGSDVGAGTFMVPEKHKVSSSKKCSVK